MSYEGTLIVIEGATAVGKTDLAIELAELLSTEIVSADSRQMYREMTIGTAVPSREQLQAVKHHFIHDRSLTSPLTAATYADEALECLRGIFRAHGVAVLAGGSGLYVDALVDGFDDLPSSGQLREELSAMPLQKLLDELRILDQQTYAAIDRSNPRRVIRAVEICRLSGSRCSELRKGPAPSHSMNVVRIALDRPREELYERINRRVDLMLESGLLDEVRSLERYRNLVPLQTVGYREMFPYLDGEISLETAVELVKRNTRRYAKRQLTWLRRNDRIRWFGAWDREGIFDYVESRMNG